MTDWFTWLAFDVVVDLAFGDSFRSVENGASPTVRISPSTSELTPHARRLLQRVARDAGQQRLPGGPGFRGSPPLPAVPAGCQILSHQRKEQAHAQQLRQPRTQHGCPAAGPRRRRVPLRLLHPAGGREVARRHCRLPRCPGQHSCRGRHRDNGHVPDGPNVLPAQEPRKARPDAGRGPGPLWHQRRDHGRVDARLPVPLCRR